MTQHIVVFPVALTDRRADLIQTAVQRISQDCYVVPRGPNPDSPGYVALDREPDAAERLALHRAATTVYLCDVYRLSHLHPTVQDVLSCDGCNPDRSTLDMYREGRIRSPITLRSLEAAARLAGKKN